MYDFVFCHASYCHMWLCFKFVSCLSIDALCLTCMHDFLCLHRGNVNDEQVFITASNQPIHIALVACMVLYIHVYMSNDVICHICMYMSSFPKMSCPGMQK